MFVSIGVDHTRAGLAVRERLHLEDEELPALVDRFSDVGASETIVTRTCNRIEAYCWWPEIDPSTPAGLGAAGWTLALAWADGDASRADLLLRNGALRHSGDAIRHLFRVAAGLESQVPGDVHILGQLRRAFLDAADAGSVGAHLHRLFEAGLRLGKRVRRETAFMATRCGVGSEAARHARRALGGLEQRRCVVVGSGKIGTQAARKLWSLGARDLEIVNRTPHRAKALAASLGGADVHDLTRIAERARRADVVVVATGAPEPVLDASHLEGAQDVLVVDVSVPRNVDTAVGRLPGVTLVDLDALHPEASEEVERARRAAIPEVQTLVEAAAREVEDWVELAGARRELGPFRRRLVDVCERELAYLDCEAEAARRIADRIAARMMASPMEALRDARQRGEDIDGHTASFASLFGRREATRVGSHRSRIPSVESGRNDEVGGASRSPMQMASTVA